MRINLLELREDISAQSIAVERASRIMECLGLAQQAELNVTFNFSPVFSGVAFCNKYSRNFNDLDDLRAICYLKLNKS